jgi:hypothetical protein
LLLLLLLLLPGDAAPGVNLAAACGTALPVMLPVRKAGAGARGGDALLLLLLGLGDLLIRDVSMRVHAWPMLLAARLSPEVSGPASGTTSDSARQHAAGTTVINGHNAAAS